MGMRDRSRTCRNNRGRARDRICPARRVPPRPHGRHPDLDWLAATLTGRFSTLDLAPWLAWTYDDTDRNDPHDRRCWLDLGLSTRSIVTLRSARYTLRPRLPRKVVGRRPRTNRPAVGRLGSTGAHAGPRRLAPRASPSVRPSTRGSTHSPTPRPANGTRIMQSPVHRLRTDHASRPPRQRRGDVRTLHLAGRINWAQGR
jgi:hypothetical protein